MLAILASHSVLVYLYRSTYHSFGLIIFSFYRSFAASGTSGTYVYLQAGLVSAAWFHVAFSMLSYAISLSYLSNQRLTECDVSEDPSLEQLKCPLNICDFQPRETLEAYLLCWPCVCVTLPSLP